MRISPSQRSHPGRSSLQAASLQAASLQAASLQRASLRLAAPNLAPARLASLPLALLLVGAVALAGCDRPSPGARPLVSSIAPHLVCAEQVGATIAVTGERLVPGQGRGADGEPLLLLPQISLLRTEDALGNLTDPANDANIVVVPNDAEDPTKSDHAWTDETSMRFGFCPPGTCSRAASPVPPLAVDYPGPVPTGLYTVQVKNRGGGKTTLGDALAVLPSPRVDGVDVDLVGLDRDDQLVVRGDFFYEVDGTPPEVTLGDDLAHVPWKKVAPGDVRLSDCRELPAPRGMQLHACKIATVTLRAGMFAVANRGDAYVTLEVHVAGPTTSEAALGCRSTSRVTVTFVPGPRLEAVVADLVCVDEVDRTVELTGTGFLTVDGKLPAIDLGGGAVTLAPTGADGCVMVGRAGAGQLDVAEPREQVQSCTRLHATLPRMSFAAGPHGITVTNPKPTDLPSSPPVALTIVPAPSLARVTTAVACHAQGDTDFVLEGAGFVGVRAVPGGAEALPTVTLTDGRGQVATYVPTLDDTTCAPLDGLLEEARSCTRLRIHVPKQAGLALGATSFHVANPSPAGCATSERVNAVVVPAPSLTSADRALLCTADGAAPLVLTGTHLLRVEGTPPSVILRDGAGRTVTIVDGQVSGCRPLNGPAQDVEDCDRITVTVPAGALAAGEEYQVTVVNPAPAGCSSTEHVSVFGAAPPVLAQVSPGALCTGGGTLTLTGMNLEQGAMIDVGPVVGQPALVDGSGTTARVALAAGLPAPVAGKPWDVTVHNPSGCSTTLPAQVAVVVGLNAFFADPPTVWNRVGTPLTIWAASVAGAIDRVLVQPVGGGTPIALSLTTPPVGGRVSALVPAGLAAGDYDVIVGDASMCSSVLTAGLKVVETPTLSLTRITPAFGYAEEPTAITIRSNAQFKDTPRAYLSFGNSPGGTATALGSVSLVDPSTLTAVVPKTSPVLGVGKYDLIVVNPDGTVGVAVGAFTVTNSPPPVITGLSPAVVGIQASTFKIVGRNFQPGAQVTFQCRDTNGNALATPGGLVIDPPDSVSCAPDQCISVTGTWPVAVCLVTLRNPDGASSEFSSLVVTNPALGQNLGTFHAASPLKVGRRGLALTTGSVGPSSRFVYALGGDTGTEAGALDTVEAAPIDALGNLGAWKLLRYPMNRKHGYTGAVHIGRYLYVIGGSEGTGASALVERACILDPARAPALSDVEIALPPAGTKGLSGGFYAYRVAAVMPANDPWNPGGEELPSDPFVQLAPALKDGSHLTVTWTPVAGAVGYRVYRSPGPDMGYGAEVLIADDVKGTQLVDAALPPLAVNGAPQRPHSLGATGVWQPVATLGSMRSGAGVTIVRDPTSPDTWTIYALGGNAATASNPSLLATTEFLRVVVTPDGTQTFGSWMPGPNLGQARWHIAAFHQTVGANGYLWAVGGLAGNGGGSTLNLVEGATIGAGGLPGTFASVTALPLRSAGGVGLGINGFLYLLGGGQGQPDAAVRQAQVTLTPPTIGSWNTGASQLGLARHLAAGAVSSGFVIVCGGDIQGTTNPTSTCETTIW